VCHYDIRSARTYTQGVAIDLGIVDTRSLLVLATTTQNIDRTFSFGVRCGLGVERSSGAGDLVAVSHSSQFSS
jgi:hypothetical protein